MDELRKDDGYLITPLSEGGDRRSYPISILNFSPTPLKILKVIGVFGYRFRYRIPKDRSQ